MAKVFEIEALTKRNNPSFNQRKPGIYIQGQGVTHGPFSSVGEALAFGESLPSADWKMFDVS